jgi:hypothetical protein
VLGAFPQRSREDPVSCKGVFKMAKVKAGARTRRPYEYDHQCGLSLHGGSVSKPSGGGTSKGGTSLRPANPAAKKAGKKR